jgi:dienelactone hydrolase
MRTLGVVLLVFAGLSIVSAALKEETIEYSADNVMMKGYLVYDDAVKGRRPGVLVVHEWWGHNEYARKRARMLAELGYTALAVDMYGDGKTADNPDDAGKFAGEVFKNLAGAKERFTAALKILRAHRTVDDKHAGAIGYCFGGGVVLAMARAGVDLQCVVSFHGSLDSPVRATKGDVHARILVCNGADDSFVPKKAIDEFMQEMKNAKVDYRFINYPGAIHSFTNPQADEYAKKFNLKIGYNEKADKRSWEDMKAFFKKTFN